MDELNFLPEEVMDNPNESELRKKSEKIWQVAEPVITEWKNRLTDFEAKHRTQISKSLEGIAGFFGKEAPEKSNVDLHFMAQKDSSKGGPASGLVDQMLLPGGDTDVFYWLGEATRLPNDGPKEFEEEERRVITKIIHEEIHQEFQGNNPVFLDVLNKTGGDEEIMRMRTELMKNQLEYLEPEVELTAIYLDQYANRRLQEDVPEESVPTHATIVFRVDEKRFHEITKAVMEDSGSEKWKNGGPYKKFTDGWRKIYDEETETPKPIESLIEPRHKTLDELSIYELGEKITDFSLIEKYISDGRQFDLAFMKELCQIFLDAREVR